VRRALLAAALVGVVGAAVTWPGASDPREASPRATPLPAPPSPALAIGAPRPLGDERGATRWAVLRRAVRARARPSRSAPVAATVVARTPEGTPTPLPVLGSRTGRADELWIRVALPVLPNGTGGWVPRRALGGYHVSRHRLVVDRAARRVVLKRAGRTVFSAEAGVGAPQWPTPRGRFIVRNRLEDFEQSPTYGPLAFGTSARSPQLTDWPAGGYVGIHGTDRPELIPGAVSHGCIRLRNRDIIRLGRLMPVGTEMVVL
jgi:hypothetical protein